MSFWNRRKSLESVSARQSHSALRPTLGWLHLISLGIGGIVGTGIYTLIGVGAGLAGPAVIISFVVAGLVCACAALAYTEMSTMMPMAGSAYTYSYVALGELPAWFVGWTLILEYTVVCSVVAVGWSGYASGFIQALGIGVPDALLAGPAAGGVINVPAIVIALAVAGLLALGSRESATVNLILVFVKLVALATFVALAIPAFDAGNFEPFAPHGFGATEIEGAKYGMMGAAAVIFFAFYGFDAVSTAAEEAKDPGRDLKIGIIGSMIACTFIYMVVATAAIGGSRTDALAASGEPLAMVLRNLDHPVAAKFIGLAAIIALPTVIMAFMYGQSRIFFVMARDGLLPQRLSVVNEKSGTPALMTMVTGVIVAIIAGFLPLQRIAEVANAGTLVAFIAVAVCMLVLRKQAPNAPRPFRTPAYTIVAWAAIVGCAYLFVSLPGVTKLTFVIWNAIGIVVYFVYARYQSALARA
ncbi:amino acid permease [Steroidobacter agaridevorans]|uniref:Amino acid permease n=1 Tax=Steroidobacter agaridevorans TaxID=2695856 RepID=A0A829YEN3_9GAMM|nr:amino acid permease [Steroidobacter agaridevorans]GFE81719.1 amino acid permease [Steroidobacter agaridevorans]GFE90463.1 amino acid permease [Steroidobacter agaridevorans]